MGGEEKICPSLRTALRQRPVNLVEVALWCVNDGVLYLLVPFPTKIHDHAHGSSSTDPKLSNF